MLVPSMVASAGWNWPSGPASSKPWTVWSPEVWRPSAWVNQTRRAVSVVVTESGERAGVFEVLAVDEVAGAEGEAGSDGLLVGRVNVVACADVDGDGHGGVGDGECAALCVADGAPVFVR